MNLRTWQQRPNLLKSARDLYDQNETFQQMMQLARDESPANTPAVMASLEPEHSRRLGQIEGYHHCLRVLEASWTKPVRPKEVEATFATPKE